MAIKGDVGKIMFENAGGTEADVGQTRSWSLSISKDIFIFFSRQENKTNLKTRHHLPFSSKLIFLKMQHLFLKLYFP